MSDLKKLHVFDLTFEEIDALSRVHGCDELKDIVIRTLQKFDLHSNVLCETRFKDRGVRCH